MKLQEHEAKEILERHGLDTPETGLDGEKEYAVKAQVLANHRKDNGGIKFAKGEKEAKASEKEIMGAQLGGQEVENVLIEEKVDIEEEYYVSFTYDTETRKPALIFSREGGTGVEDRKVEKLALEDGSQFRFREFLSQNGFEGKELIKMGMELQKLFEVFLEEDAVLLEVNPLAKTLEGYVAVDAMMELDDDASYRHDWNYPERSAFDREKTSRELRAQKIDEDDHRGVAGKYTELEGDVGMMLAGGGASLTNMDALMACGGKPANYTEYGGNPPTEKVYKLSKVIMSKDLNGLWHVGGTANNTDILRTMKGFVKALEEEKPEYPIVIRRDGPNADGAFELLREKREELGLNMKLFRNDTPMTETAEVLMEMMEE